jgi:hypothetical protein
MAFAGTCRFETLPFTRSHQLFKLESGNVGMRCIYIDRFHHNLEEPCRVQEVWLGGGPYLLPELVLIVSPVL